MNGQLPKARIISLRMPLYFDEGNGSLRLDILAQKYENTETYTMSIHVYKKGTLLENYSSYSWIKIFNELSSWFDRHGTKPEVVKDGKG